MTPMGVDADERGTGVKSHGEVISSYISVPFNTGFSHLAFIRVFISDFIRTQLV